MSGRRIKTNAGFSLVELLIVIAVIAVLAVIVGVYVAGGRERSYFTRSNAEFGTIANALNLYIAKYNDYPADVSRDLPAGLSEFIAKDAQGQDWPDAPYPGSVYDYENWQINNGSGETVHTLQVSIRFCPPGGLLSTCKFPNEEWAKDFGVNSALYYCIEGLCRAHNSQAATYPGYCVNCPNNRAIGI